MPHLLPRLVLAAVNSPATVRVPRRAGGAQVHAFVARAATTGAVAAELARLPARRRQPAVLGAAVERFLDGADLAVTSRRVYAASLAVFTAGAGSDRALVDPGVDRQADLDGGP